MTNTPDLKDLIKRLKKMHNAAYINPSMKYCKSCRWAGMAHCSDVAHCGGMELDVRDRPEYQAYVDVLVQSAVKVILAAEDSLRQEPDEGVRERIKAAMNERVSMEVPDTDAICTTCRGRGNHLKVCPRVDEPWPTITVTRSKTMDEQVEAILKALPRTGEVEREAWRPEVRAFADLMEAKLRENDDKPGWKGDNPFDLLNRLQSEKSELSQVTRKAFDETGWPKPEREDWQPRGNKFDYRFATDAEQAELIPEIGREAADVGNFAMMIADVCGALPDAALPSGWRSDKDE